MKKFLLKTLAFFFPVLLVLAGAEAYVRTLPNTYKYKEAWMWRNAHAVQTLLLGNSHGYFACVPSLMGDSVFNLCNVSQRLEHDYFLLRRYENLYEKLNTLVLLIDNSCLFDAPMEADEPARVTYYQLYMGFPKHSRWSRYGFELSSITAFLNKLGQRWGADGLECDSLGFGTSYRVEERDPVCFEPEHITVHHFVDWPTTRQNISYADSIACWCQARNVRLVLLMTPVSVYYKEKAEPWQLDFVRTFADSCRQAYGCRVLDYSDDARFVDEDFFDSDHLDDQGAKKFSKILGADLFGQQ